MKAKLGGGTCAVCTLRCLITHPKSVSIFGALCNSKSLGGIIHGYIRRVFNRSNLVRTQALLKEATFSQWEPPSLRNIRVAICRYLFWRGKHFEVLVRLWGLITLHEAYGTL